MAEKREYLYNETKKALLKRGVKLEKIAELVVDSQQKHSPEITMEQAMDNVENVLKKREVQHAVITGVELDILAEDGKLSEPLLSIIKRDEGLYGVDETLAVSIVNCYGSIALSNFGYLDITKPKIIGDFNDKVLKEGEVHTFLDDIICSIAAAACSRYAHNEEKRVK